MTVSYTARAARGLGRILADIAEHSPQGAARVQGRMKTVIAMVVEFPQAGRATVRRGTRRIVVTPYPYLIFHRIVGDRIVIDAVRHAARS